MNRLSVNSSSIKSIGYNAVNKILEVEFKRGAIYQYLKIPNDVYNQLINASSIGSYFMKNIAKKYSFKMI